MRRRLCFVFAPECGELFSFRATAAGGHGKRDIMGNESDAPPARAIGVDIAVFRSIQRWLCFAFAATAANMKNSIKNAGINKRGINIQYRQHIKQTSIYKHRSQL